MRELVVGLILLALLFMAFGGYRRRG